jgi:hypothetical protein
MNTRAASALILFVASLAPALARAEPIFSTLKLNFAKQHRTMLDDDVYLVYAWGSLTRADVPLASLRLTDPTGRPLLDKERGIGAWIAPWAAIVPDPRRFWLQAVEKSPYVAGKYLLEGSLANGAGFSVEIEVPRTHPEDRPRVHEPKPQEVLFTSTPRFRWDPYVFSPPFSPSSRRLTLAVETGPTEIWEKFPGDPDATAAAIGDPDALGPSELPHKGEYVVTIGHSETRRVKFVDLALENRVSIHFFYQ